jgi:hypothetical protein
MTSREEKNKTLFAFCSSNRCAGIGSVRPVLKEGVVYGLRICSDCGHALVWSSQKTRINYRTSRNGKIENRDSL